MQETWVQSLGWEDTLEKWMDSLQYSGLKNSMNRGVWHATVHGVAKSRTKLIDFHFHVCINLNILYYYIDVCVLSCDQLFAALWSIAHQAPLYMNLFLVRILERVAISSSRESFWPRYWTHFSCISCTGRPILYHWTTWKFPLLYIPIVNILLFQFLQCNCYWWL